MEKYTFVFSKFYILNSTFLFISWEEGEDDARSAWPFDILGYTRDTMDGTTRCDEVILSKS